MANEATLLLSPLGSIMKEKNHGGKKLCCTLTQDDVIIMATTTITTTTTSPDRTKVRNAQTTTPLTHEASTPMSTCSASSSSAAATPTDATYLEHSPASTSNNTSFSLPSSSSTTTTTATTTTTSSVRVPLPSPSRSRLDRQYAKRLATSCAFYHTTPTAKRPNASPPTTTSSSSSSKCDESQHHSLLSIMKPPQITREHHHDQSFFRPTPILTGTTTSSSRDTEEMHHRTTKRFFFPSTPDTQVSNKNMPSPFASTTTTATSSSTSIYSASSNTPLAGSGSSSLLLRRNRNSNNSLNSNSPNNDSTDLGTSDRFIPSRATSNMNVNLWDTMGTYSSRSCTTSVTYDSDSTSNNSNNNNTADGSSHHRTHVVASDDSNAASGHIVGGRANDLTPTTQQNLHNMLLRSELLGENISPYAPSVASQLNGNSRIGGGPHSGPFRGDDGINRLRYQSPRLAFHESIFHEDMGPTAVVNSFSLTPFGTASSQRLMAAPQKRRRKIAKVPFKVLDAPALQDDFYLNLVDWSSQNVLAVGLGSCVYLWSACTSKVTKLCDLATSDDLVTSVAWAQRGVHLAVGTNKGETQLWDTIKVKKIKTMAGHSARVGTLAWTGPVLASGSRDRLIFLRDVRCNSPFTERLTAHRQEVCGLRWSFDEPAFLASGGNDNQLHVVDSRNPTQPVHRFSDHTAAVKAIAWSPHQHGLLASGGGTADRCIRFWNTLSGAALSSVDTGSQVCNLAWSQNCNEIVSTHGYSLNQIVVWRYPSLNKVVTLTGHTYRVLYLAVSPDGSTIVTGAGDETLRFWQVFPGPRSDVKNSAGGLLFPNTLGSVIR
ncbi:myosin heavy-chain kinase [Nitzschia inconspicua]|uniref:Myosin heavy-chain kinase n=1 Tax=Nitzschia inconspicua TaxID=303405 RepID=A0A9K3K9P7_9STRA|nr:myosin heavy-chain kinase [Nitzschia inconspicua]KAG7340107.1 myosin heavy-chain kinase [Nitzschia inconspicua]